MSTKQDLFLSSFHQQLILRYVPFPFIFHQLITERSLYTIFCDRNFNSREGVRDWSFFLPASPTFILYFFNVFSNVSINLLKVLVGSTVRDLNRLRRASVKITKSWLGYFENTSTVGGIKSVEINFLECWTRGWIILKLG